MTSSNIDLSKFPVLQGQQNYADWAIEVESTAMLGSFRPAFIRTNTATINTDTCYVQIPKESRRSWGGEGESGSGSGGSYRLPVATGSRHGCKWPKTKHKVQGQDGLWRTLLEDTEARHWGQRGCYPGGKLRAYWEFLNNIPSIFPLGKLKVVWRFIFHFALKKPSG